MRTGLLIVEDDQQLLRVYERFFSRWYDNVFVADTISHANNMILNDNIDITAAILDLKIGTASSFDLVPAIKATHVETFVILVSALVSIQTTVEALHLGFDDVLAKPVSGPEILARLPSTGRRTNVKPLDDYRSPTALPKIQFPQLLTAARVLWEYASRVLFESDGNVSLAARRLGVDRNTLKRWLRAVPPR